MSDYGPNLFAGTAEFYAKYRAPYPSTMFNDVVEFFDLNGRGSLVDLGCGTGELAIPLAKYFDNVLALDPEPEMLQQATSKAKQAHITNIDWQIGSSETITEVNRQFKLITIGQAFHWMDSKTLLNCLYRLLEPSGGLFIVASSPDVSKHYKIASQKDKFAKQLFSKYLGSERRAGKLVYKPSGLKWEQDLFSKSKFRSFEKQIYKTKIKRGVNEELGFLYSLSWARSVYFGVRIKQFEAEFCSGLEAISHTKKFMNELVFQAYFLRK